MSGLVVARRSLLAEDYRDRSSSLQPEVSKVTARFPGAFKETTDSSRQDQKPHIQVIGPNKKEDGRHSSKDPIPVSSSILASFPAFHDGFFFLIKFSLLLITLVILQIVMTVYFLFI